MQTCFPDLALPSGSWTKLGTEHYWFLLLLPSCEVQIVCILPAAKFRRWRCSKSSFLRSCTVTLLMLSPLESLICPSNVSHTSCINCRCSVRSVRWRLHLRCRSFNRPSALFFLLWLWLTDSTHTHTHTHAPSLPHLMKIDLFCLDFHRAFSPQRFFTAESAVCFLRVRPGRKRKGHRARPQTTVEGRYKRYWNSLLIFPVLSAGPLRQRAVFSAHWAWRYSPLKVSVLFIHVFSVWAWTLLGSLVTSRFHAVSLQSRLVHCTSVKVTS